MLLCLCQNTIIIELHLWKKQTLAVMTQKEIVLPGTHQKALKTFITWRKNLFQMRVFCLLPFLHTCELIRPPEVFKASLKLLFFAWLLIYLHNIKLESPPLSNCHFLQVFRFGLPEKLGTGQEGPDFLQWDGWEGGVMPKQVLFCLGQLYDTPVLTKEYFTRWVSASICATLPWILGVKARRQSCVSFR